MSTPASMLPPAPAREAVLGELHLGIWRGTLLVELGSLFAHFYHPRRLRA